MNDLFPLGIATDNAFCNRTKEREQLQSNMLHSRHALIVMTRRHGKSSLLAQTFEDVAGRHAALTESAYSPDAGLALTAAGLLAMKNNMNILTS